MLSIIAAGPRGRFPCGRFSRGLFPRGRFPRSPHLSPLPSFPALTSRNWYQNEIDEELKGVDSTDTVKHTERA